MSDQGQVLLDLCNGVIRNPALAPELDPITEKVLVTHCNQGAFFVATGMGCNEFTADMNADQMILQMRGNLTGRWKKVNGSEATIHALGGGLGFACMTSDELDEDHGHIATIFPIGQGYSGSLKKDVPFCANVGVSQAEEKVTQAFPVSKGEPEYWIFS